MRLHHVFGFSCVALAAGAASLAACSGGSGSSGRFLPDGAPIPTGAGDGGIGERDGAALDAAFARCPGVDITQDGVLDFDIRPVAITGRITLNSAAFPSGKNGSGRIVFTEETDKTSASIPINAGGNYAVTLAPGTYSASYAPESQTCGAGPLPCAGGILKKGISIASDGNLDLDVPVVTVSGALSLAGAPFPRGAQGTFSFSSEDSGQTGTFTSLSSATYSAVLVAGTYTARFIGNGQCTSASTAPCNGGVLKSKVALLTSGNLDLDVPVVKVQGRVTLDGAAIPSRVERFTIGFNGAEGTDDGPSESAIAPNGTGQYSVNLFPGSYDILYQSQSTCASSVSMPCNNGRLKLATSLKSNGTLDIDIPSAKIQGLISLNGVAITGSERNPGAITFARSSLSAAGLGNESSASVTIGRSPNYNAILLAGKYTIGYEATQGCTDTVEFPCNSGPLKKEIQLSGRGNLDVDIPVVSVRGAVTVNGTPARSTTEKSILTFSLSESGGSAITEDIATSPTYSLKLLPGTYEVGYQPQTLECDAQGSLPCNPGVITPKAVLDKSGNLDVDIPVARVRGTITVKGAAPPASLGSFGTLTFSNKGGGSFANEFTGKSASMAYEGRLLKGKYVVLYEGPSDLCDGTSAPALPCNAMSLAGCSAR